MSTYRERRETEKKAKPRTVFVSFVYFVFVLVVAFFLSGFLMEQVDLGDLLVFRIPLINRAVPQWVFQLALAAIIFLFLQFIFIIILGLFGGKKREEELYKPDQNWRR